MSDENEEKGPVPEPGESSSQDSPEEFSTQPATQPMEGNDSQDETMDESQTEYEEKQIWGVLYPLDENWRAVCLTSDMVTFGRSSSNTFVIDRDQAGDAINVVSKVHMVIRRDADGVKLVDKSSNGTFVSKKKLGKGKSRLLLQNCTIGLTDPGRPEYIYMSTSKDYQMDYPKEIRRNYLMSKELGSGACGTVYLGFKVSGGSASKESPQRVAVKKVDKKNVPMNRGVTSDVMNEVRILKAIDHPSVIRLYDAVDTEEYLYIVLELADGGELFDKIRDKTRLTELEAKVVFIQLASALKYLHSKNIAHRDLKPENILLSSSDDNKMLCKITDMGLSKLVDLDAQSKLKTFCGTLLYLAPEVLKSRVRGDGSYGLEVDNWSLGVILYVMISGMPPFNQERKDKDLMRQVCDGDWSFNNPFWESVSTEAKNLIENLMSVSISRRLTAAQALEHPWLRDAEAQKKAKELKEWSVRLRPEQQGESDGRIDLDDLSQDLPPPTNSLDPPRPIISEPFKEPPKRTLPGETGSNQNKPPEQNIEPPAKKICV